MTEYAPVHLHFGKEIEMDGIVAEIENKHEKRKVRAEKIWKTVCETYTDFPIPYTL